MNTDKVSRYHTYLLPIIVLGLMTMTTMQASAAIQIGPGTLPDWHTRAQVKLGWVFDDPTNPQASSPLQGWDKAIGDIPVWSYNASRTAYGQPAQWYIRILNLHNNNPVKNFWVSWVYEFDPYWTTDRSATNIAWFPSTSYENYTYREEWFDGNGIITTDHLKAVYARITLSLDQHPNPEYEDVWLGVYGGSKKALEVYINTFTEVNKPVADCGSDKLKCENVASPVSFNASASYDPDGNITSYAWDFGDGANGTGVAPTHKYSTYRWNGTAYLPFTVNLSVTDNDGLTNSTSQKVIIWIAGDSNGDGKVNILDASLVGLRWGSSDPRADLNNDGKVNIIDASIIGLNWGKKA